MKIDIFAHILPEKYWAAVQKKVKLPSDFQRPEPKNRANCDLDFRLRIMDRYPDVVQVLTLSLPSLEMLVKPGDAVELAKMANDEIAETVYKHADKFIAGVACLPLNDIDASLKEIDRTITDLKFKGVQVFTNISGETLDMPKFRPIYEKMVQYDLPLWIHPYVDFKGRRSVFVFAYETALAMETLVCAGIFRDYPDIKFITHHCGSMIPFFEQRIRWLLPEMTRKGPHINNPLEHFRKFYNDTAVYGSTPALMCGYEFFGADHILFGTDAPLGPEYGLTSVTIHSIERMNIPESEKEKIFEQNAIDLLHLAL
jgi:predicted TIM-barrel fold metal-dependent hydrolase